MMSNIMDKVDEELRNDWNEDSIRNLSPQLIGRIAALSQSFKPYRFWQDSVLVENSLSPERGQLLLALVKSDLDSITYANIYEGSTFNNAYLERSNLNNAFLRNARLLEADFSYSHLRNAKFNNADLRGAIFRNTDLINTNFASADLRYADLRNSYIWLSDMRYAKLIGADLRNADLRNANLRNADLSNAYLNETYLSGANFQETNLKNTNFWNAKVKKIDWLKELENQIGEEINHIKKKWVVDSIFNIDTRGDYYLIKPKS